MKKMMLYNAFLIVALWSVFFGHHTDAVLNTSPPCVDDLAYICLQNAISSAEPSACNWNLIVPRLKTCVDEAMSGCTTQEIDQWIDRLNEFNASLTTVICNFTCPNLESRAARMQDCYTVTDSGQAYQLSDVINSILQSPSVTNPSCPLLQTALACLTSATDGCTALMDITNQRLQSMNYTDATTACNVPSFSGPTTSAPLAILQSATLTHPSTTTLAAGLIVVGDGSNNQMSVSWIILIVLGAVFIIAIVVIIAFLARQIYNNRKENKQLLLADELPRADSDDVTQSSNAWRMRSSKYINNNESSSSVVWPGHQSTTPAPYQSVYRRDFVNR